AICIILRCSQGVFFIAGGAFREKNDGWTDVLVRVEVEGLVPRFGIMVCGGLSCAVCCECDGHARFHGGICSSSCYIRAIAILSKMPDSLAAASVFFFSGGRRIRRKGW
ncbi:unnamed protein product, partial [Sphacelaria rigidula]